MNLEQHIRERLKKKPVLVMSHLICGYPSLDDNRQMLQIMHDAGVDLVEFQFPFSEPSADGPVFTRANQKALDAGTRVADCFELMAWASSKFSFMPVMMGYTNTVIQYGEDAFCQKIAACGGRALIIPDHPPEEDTQLLAAAKAHGLCVIMLMTPTNTDERLHTLGTKASGFVYGVARRGVTGAKTAFDTGVATCIDRYRHATSLPLAIGFGISSSDDVAFLKGRAEIAVVGTAFLTAWETSGPDAAKQLLAALT